MRQGKLCLAEKIVSTLSQPERWGTLGVNQYEVLRNWYHVLMYTTTMQSSYDGCKIQVKENL